MRLLNGTVGVAALSAAGILTGACGAGGAERAGQSSNEAPIQNPEPLDQRMVIRVVVTIKPNRVEEFAAQILSEAPRVRALQGCERYELFRDGERPERFFLYEEWTTRQAFEAYQQSDLLQESFATLGPMMDGAPDSAYYVVSHRTN